MTRERIFGEDTPFGAWVRKQEDLPAVDKDCALSVTDTDMIFHRYKACKDTLGKREIQCLAWLEVKSRSAVPPPAQRDTLFKMHRQLTRGIKPGRDFANVRNGGHSEYHYGIAVLSMSGTTPEDSDTMRWFRFQDNGQLSAPISVTTMQLIQLLRFELKWSDCITPSEFRRHHKTYTESVKEVTPLGFEVFRVIHRRS